MGCDQSKAQSFDVTVDEARQPQGLANRHEHNGNGTDGISHVTAPVKLETVDEPTTTPLGRRIDEAKKEPALLPPPTTEAVKEPKAETPKTPDDEFEVVACKVDELQLGEMRHIAIPGRKQQVLLGKGYDGKHFAMGTACAHYNAFLKNGVLSNDRIRCAWHGACFNINTGDIEEYPCNDGVHVFQLKTVGENVIITGNGNNVDNQKKAFAVVKCSSSEKPETVIIVGAGGAGLTCAETLRKENFNGRIIMLTQERHPPYDRPKLSKALESTIDKVQLRKEDFLKQHNIELRCNAQVLSVDFESQFVQLSGESSQTIPYDHLVIATGQRVRRLRSEHMGGTDWKNIYYMRTLEDANAICIAGKNKSVAVLGSSFIGMETAAYFSDKATSVNVISKTRVPFQASLGMEVGEALKTELFDKKGVKFLANVSIERYEGDASEQVLKQVHLTDGTVLDVDVLVAGIGTIPNTEFLQDSGININSISQALVVDEYMATNIPNVYGAGDVTEFPLTLYDGVKTTIGHWNLAQSQGKIAALSIVCKKTPLLSVPYFWTTIFAKSVRFAGYSHQFDQVFIHGSLNGLKFVAYYLEGDKVVAASSLMYDPVVSRYAELIAKGAKITLDIIKDDPELTKTAEKHFSMAV